MPTVILKPPTGNVPARIDTTDEVRCGGEGTVYFSTDGRFAIKIYHQPRTDKEVLLRYVMTLFQSLTAEHEHFILPPLALVESVDGQPKVGFVMRRVPSRYRELVDFALSPVAAARHFLEGKTWGHYLRVARSVANAIVVLHGMGCAHSDIHFRNFLTNLDEGDAIMLEIDGVVVHGFLPPQVTGMMGFMAPEILTHKADPSERTDRHSLAVLILHTLLFRNVLQPLVEYDDDANVSEELAWGQKALFSEDSNDRRHFPRNMGLPLYQSGALSYRMLSPVLQTLTERAFVSGLRQPNKRPSAREWEEGLGCACDGLWMCYKCKQFFPYQYWQQPRLRRSCPFCGERVSIHPIVIQLYEEKSKGDYFAIERHVVLGNGFKVFGDVVDRRRSRSLNRKDEKAIGHIEHDMKAGEYRLVNDDGGEWKMRSADGGKEYSAFRGQSLPVLTRGLLHFGKGCRVGRIMEAGSSD